MISNFEYASCNAISIASNGMGSLAHIARLSNSISFSLFLFLLLLLLLLLVSSLLLPLIVSSDNVNHCAKLILFSVIVPVLSVQITFALPKVSTVFVCFTMIPIFIKRQEPKAMNVVNATGISSGIMLMAKVSAFNRLSKTLFEL